MHKKTILTGIWVLFSTPLWAQWASYNDMIRREQREIADYIQRRNASYNKPAASTSVLYDYKIQQQQKKDAEKAARQKEYKRIQQSLDSLDKIENRRREIASRQWQLERAAFLQQAQPAIDHVQQEYQLTPEETENFVKETLMPGGKLITDYRQASLVLGDIKTLETTLAALPKATAYKKLESATGISGIAPSRLLDIGLSLEALYPNDSTANDNMFFNLFRVYYNSFNTFYIADPLQHEKYYTRFEQIEKRYPVLTMKFIKDHLRYNPYEHKVKIILAKKLSSGKEKAELEKAFTQQKDLEFGIPGYTNALSSAGGIIQLAAMLDESPAYLMLNKNIQYLSTLPGNSLVMDIKNHPHFKYWKAVAETGDSMSIRGYILNTYYTKGPKKAVTELLEFAAEQALKGNITSYRLVFEIIPQSADGRCILSTEGPGALGKYFKALAIKESAEEITRIKNILGSWLQPLTGKCNDKTPPLKEILLQAVYTEKTSG